MQNTHQEQGAEITFAVHPRPAVLDAAHPDHDDLPLRLVAPPPVGTAPEDVSRHPDTPAGDIAFLARFAFGGY